MTPQRRPLWKRLIRFAIFSVIVLVTILALLLSWLSFEGRRDWARTKAALLARGEKLSLVELASPPLPDDRNFFADPIWSQLAETHEVINEFGIPTQEPIVPAGQRLIDAMDPPLPSSLLARANELFPPDEPPRISSDSSCWTAAKYAFQHFDKSGDSTRRQALATFALDALACGQPMRNHIESLLDRGGARYPYDFSIGFPASFNHLTYLLRLASINTLLARAHLELGQSAPAADALLTNLRLVHTLDRDPLLLTVLVQVSMTTLVTSAIDRGIAAHQWTDDDLRTLDHALADMDLPRLLADSLRRERGGGNQLFEAIHREDPRVRTRQIGAFQLALADFDMGFRNQFCQQYIDALESPAGIRTSDLPTMKKAGRLQRFLHVFTVAFSDGLLNALARTIYAQETVQMSRIAIALERHRLRHGSYPASLSALQPAYFTRLPPTTLRHRPFHYRVDANGRFRLWSDGWDGIDGGGEPSHTRNDTLTGDWVWNTPPAAGKSR